MGAVLKRRGAAKEPEGWPKAIEAQGLPRRPEQGSKSNGRESAAENAAGEKAEAKTASAEKSAAEIAEAVIAAAREASAEKTAAERSCVWANVIGSGDDSRDKTAKPVSGHAVHHQILCLLGEQGV